jgi:hypothetical protein
MYVSVITVNILITHLCFVILPKKISHLLIRLTLKKKPILKRILTKDVQPRSCNCSSTASHGATRSAVTSHGLEIPHTTDYSVKFLSNTENSNRISFVILML